MTGTLNMGGHTVTNFSSLAAAGDIHLTSATNNTDVGIGYGGTTLGGSNAVAIGTFANSTATGNVVIGQQAQGDGANGISIGAH